MDTVGFDQLVERIYGELFGLLKENRDLVRENNKLKERISRLEKALGIFKFWV
jgi:hypothetical protein